MTATLTMTLEAVAQRWLAWVVPATWQIALLVAIIAAVAWAARRVSPRLRYALWLLVLVKVFLPPSLAIGWGVGNWGVRPLWNSVEPTAQQFWDTQRGLETATNTFPATKNIANEQTILEGGSSTGLSLTGMLFTIWCLGCLVFAALVLWHYWRLTLSIRQMQLVDEGALSVSHQKIALQLELKRIPEVYLSDEATSPFLFGILRPRIVLPRRMADELKTSDLDSVLLHELSHWKRRDTWIGWLQVFGQSLF